MQPEIFTHIFGFPCFILCLFPCISVQALQHCAGGKSLADSRVTKDVLIVQQISKGCTDLLLTCSARRLGWRLLPSRSFWVSRSGSALLKLGHKEVNSEQRGSKPGPSLGWGCSSPDKEMDLWSSSSQSCSRSNDLSESNGMDVKKRTLNWRKSIYSSRTVLLTIHVFLPLKVFLQSAPLVIFLTLSSALLRQLGNAEMVV